VRRVIKNKKKLSCFEDIQQTKRAMMWKIFLLFVGTVALIEMIVEGALYSFPYARNFGTWSLLFCMVFCLVVLSIRYLHNKVKPTTFVVAYMTILDTWGTIALFSSITNWFWFAWPSCASGNCNVFRFPELVMFIALPTSVCIEFLNLPASVRTDYLKISPNGSFASLLLFVFLSFDWIGNRDSENAKEYFYATGYYLFAPDTLFAIPFWIMLFFAQYLLINKLFIRKLLLRKRKGANEVITAEEEKLEDASCDNSLKIISK